MSEEFSDKGVEVSGLTVSWWREMRGGGERWMAAVDGETTVAVVVLLVRCLLERDGSLDGVLACEKVEEEMEKMGVGKQWLTKAIGEQEYAAEWAVHKRRIKWLTWE